MTTDQLNQIIHALGRLKTAIQTIITGSTQLVKDTQSITGTSMVLANTPTFIFLVSVNGVVQTLTTDYTIAGATITFVETWAADSVTVVYKY